MSNIKDVARKANTSTATVSRVINGTGYVSEEMKKKVYRAIEELNYRPLQREGLNKKTKTIALFVPDIENPFFGKMTKEISKIANELKYNILLINLSGLKNDGGKFLMDLISFNVDGVIYVSSYRLEDVIERAKGLDIPLVVLDREIKKMDIDVVSVDNVRAGYIATKHLLDLGHKKIAYLGSVQNMGISLSRCEGYKMALEEEKIDYSKELLIDGDFTMESGYLGIKEAMEKDLEFSAIVAANDLMAIGAMNCLNIEGIKIPERVSIVGFDNIELSSSITPKLTTVSYPLTRMSELAMDSILRQIDKKEHICEEISLYPNLIVRDSTRKL